MTMSLSDFKSQVRDVARPNRFLVNVIPNPAIFLDNAVQTAIANPLRISSLVKTVINSPDLQYLCKAASVPGREIVEFQHKMQGTTRKVPGDVIYPDYELTFLNDSNYVARTFFEVWSEAIQTSPNSNIRQPFNLIEGSVIILRHMGADNSAIATYTLFDVWPKIIQGPDLNMETSDQASEFTVTFAYSYWKRVL